MPWTYTFENLMFFEFCMGPKTTKQGNTYTIEKKGNGIKIRSFPECQPLAKGHQIKHYPLQKEHHTHSRFKVSRLIFVN